MNHSPLILIVDDDRHISKVIGFSLRQAGLRILTAHDAMEGVSVARNVHPDAILMDVMMPGVTGSMVSGLMKETPELRDIPVILISALPEEDLRSRAAEVDAAGYICKPFHKSDLLQMIQSVLARQTHNVGPD